MLSDVNINLKKHGSTFKLLCIYVSESVLHHFFQIAKIIFLYSTLRTRNIHVSTYSITTATSMTTATKLCAIIYFAKK